MMSLAILLVLFIGVYSGYRNGIIIALIRTIGYTITLILAFDYYELVSEFIYLIVPYPSPFAPAENPYAYYDMDMIFTLDASYYYLISFLLILLIGWLVSRFISDFLLSFTENLPVPKPLDGIFGAITGFITHYLAIFLILFTLSTIPFDWVQNTLSKSWLADSMLTSTPFLSENAYQYFIADVHEEEVEQLPTMDLEDLKEKTDSEEENEEE